MHVKRRKSFGEIESLELGFGPIIPPFMNVHIFLADGVLFDTGQSNMRRYILKALRDKKIDMILLTHHHEDHSGNAAAIMKKHKASVFGHPLTVEKMRQRSNIMPYQRFVWGKSTPLKVLPFPSIIESENLELIPIHTPGHSPDHTVYLERNKGWLFSGDLYLGDHIKYFRSDENIADQIKSIRKVLKSDFEVLLCAHRPQMKKGKTRLKAKLGFLEDFFDSVAKRWERGLSAEEIFRELQLKEEILIRLICFGNVSQMNMVRSVISTLESREEI